MPDSFFYAAKPRLSREPRPMQTLHSSHPSLGAASRLSLLSLGCCTCDGPKVQSPFAPSAQEICAKNQPSSQATPSLIFYLISYALKRKGRMSYRRYRNLHATCCILQHLQQSCCRTLRLIPLKRKGRLTEIDGIKICVEKILWSPPYFSLSFELQEFTRFFFLLDFMKKKRPSNRDRRSRNLRTFHRHLVVAQALLCRCGVSHLISYALKRKEKERSLSKESRKQRTPKPSLRLRQRCGRSIDRRRRRLLLLHSSLSHPSPRLVWLWSCGACLTKSGQTPFSLVGSVQSRRPPGSSTQLFHTLHSGYGFFPCLRWGFGPSVWFCCCGSLRCCRPSGFPGLFVRGGRFGWRFRGGFYSSGCCKEHGL